MIPRLLQLSLYMEIEKEVSLWGIDFGFFHYLHWLRGRFASSSDMSIFTPGMTSDGSALTEFSFVSLVATTKACSSGAFSAMELLFPLLVSAGRLRGLSAGLTYGMDATWWIQFSDVSFSCFKVKVKCYLEGCIEVMVFGEKFLLNVGACAANTADKAVAKGLREIFPKLTSDSQSLEGDREFGYTLVFCLPMHLWNRYRSTMTSFFGARRYFSMSFLSVCGLVDGGQRSASVSYALAPITDIRMARLLCMSLSSARILFGTKYCSRRSI